MQSVFAEKPRFDSALVAAAADCDVFEGYSQGHSLAMAEVIGELASRFGCDEHDRKTLQQATLIRNIGERIMNREYIAEARILTSAERTDLQRHPVIGEQAVAKLGLSRAVQLIVRWHHEHWNGSGYPDALEGNQIPLAARLLRVVDTYYSLMNARPFRAALSDEMAKKHLIDWTAIEFDPAVVKAFFETLDASATQAAEVSTHELNAEPVAI